MKKEELYIVVPITNPQRYKSREKLFREFEARMKTCGANLWVVELALGDRLFEFTSPTNPQHIQLRTEVELWHKENVINIAISRLPADWKYVAWVDADIEFFNEDWIVETLQQLQHYNVVQMWQTAIDMGPAGQVINTFSSFVWCYLQGLEYRPSPRAAYYYPSAVTPGIYWHPGFAWAATRAAIDGLGGLIDRAILGAGDHHMATSLVDLGKFSIPSGLSGNYSDYVKRWQYNAERFVRRDVGFVPGTIRHSWHGKKQDRKYWDRWEVVKKYDFDPVRDLKRDWQGIYQIVDDMTPRIIGLRDGIRAYFRARNEDSVDL